ncbi:MAG TPA: glutathione S-transferase family protein [Burkholderiaceae bacterium]|jgi:glutathione S-transferase|nr:glutathione S-transferase family protein [Burkholderiaceae bacterium]
MVDFHFGMNSGNSARSALALYEAGIAFEPHALDLRKPRSTQYLALNPAGKVPTLIDGQTTLWESNAINWYIAEKSPAARLLPCTPEGRAAVLRWAFFQASHVSPAATAVHRSINPAHVRHFGQRTDAQQAEHGRKELARFLPVLESALTGADWLVQEYSLADIAFAPHLGFLLQYGWDFPGTPRVRGWLERIRARPAWHKTLALIFDGYAP